MEKPDIIDSKFKIENIDEKHQINTTDLKQNEEVKIPDIENYLKYDFQSKFDNIKIDDFDEYNFSEENIDVGLLEETDDIIVYKPPQNINDNLLMQLNFNFTASDIFVEKPYHRKYKQDSIHIFSKQNFMLNRLKHTPKLTLQYTLAKYIRNQKYKIVNIFEYIYTMGFLIKKIQGFKKKQGKF